MLLGNITRVADGDIFYYWTTQGIRNLRTAMNNARKGAGDAYDLSRLQKLLPGFHIELHDQIDSTQERARRLVQTSLLLPTLIVAEQQTAGSGRGANRWWSASGAITVSLIVDVGAFHVGPGQISLAAAWAVCDLIKQMVGDATCGIKWPNDIYLGARKVSGLLIEIPVVRAAGRRLVCGVGINVNNSVGGAPEDVATRSVSLLDVTKHAHDRTSL